MAPRKKNKRAVSKEEAIQKAELSWERRLDSDEELDDSILSWGKKYFSEYFTAPENVIHTWLDEKALLPLRYQYDEREDDYKLCLIAPRGAAKSTIISFLLIIWAVVHETEKFILICSNTSDQAKGFLADVKKELETNVDLAEDYPWACGKGRERWGQQEIATRNGITIKAIGAAGAIRGARKGATRPTLVVLDDPEGDKHKWSQPERTKIFDWVKETILPIGAPGTAFLVAGTTIHEDGLVNRLHEQGNGWNSRKFQAVTSWPKHQKLWDVWERIYTNHSRQDREAAAEAFYHQHKKLMDLEFHSYWPERFPPMKLMKLRVDMGVASFGQEYQNDAIPADATFDHKYFGDWLHVNAFPPEEEIVWKTMSLDPSLGKESNDGDYSAIVKCAVCIRKLFWIEIDLKVRPVTDMINDMIERWEEFKAPVFGVESNGFQELLLPMIKARLKEINLQRRRHNKPIIKIPIMEINNNENKKQRIRRLEPRLSAKTLRIVQNPDSFLLTSQLKRFPKGHDDGPDATEMAIRLALLLSHGSLNKRKGKRTKRA